MFEQMSVEARLISCVFLKHALLILLFTENLFCTCNPLVLTRINYLPFPRDLYLCFSGAGILGSSMHSLSYIYFILVCFLCRVRDGTQVFMFTRQTFY